MKAGVWLFLLCGPLWAQPLDPALVPESLRVLVKVKPANASFLCGIKAKGSLKVKLQHLDASGEVLLVRNTDYSPQLELLQVGVAADGYETFLTQVPLAKLMEGQPAAVPLWEDTVRLKPLTVRAWVESNPWVWVFFLGIPLLGVVGAAGFLRLRRARQLELQREERLRERGLKREGRIGLLVDGLQIQDELGAGGMATVYRVEAVDHPGQPMALKIIDQVGESRDQRLRYHREVSICARLRHPNLVLIHRAIESDDFMGILMEYVEGESLRRWVGRPIPLPQLTQWAIEIGEGLSYAHQQGVIHRDLKPDNVMLTRKGKVKVMDFGIARDTQVSMLTAAGGIVGTLAYMAPEQIAGGEVTAALDQYALGVMLFELVTGQLPFHSENPVELLRMHSEDPPPEASSFRPGLPERWNRVLQRLMAKRPQDRYADILSGAQALKP